MNLYNINSARRKIVCGEMRLRKSWGFIQHRFWHGERKIEAGLKRKLFGWYQKKNSGFGSMTSMREVEDPKKSGLDKIRRKILVLVTESNVL